MSKNNKKLIVVLGMHRSGTSAITRSLEMLGVGLGSNLHPAGADNPTGFWEDSDILEINEELLHLHGTAYDRLGLAQEFNKNDPSIDSLRQKATQLLLRKLEDSNGFFGFKDPRTCRLLPFWRDVFDSVGCEVLCIIASRNPLSVTSSLMARNGIPFEKGYFLWLQHMLPAVLNALNFSSVVIDYDLLVNEPLKQVSRISAAFGLPMVEPDSPVAFAFTNDFLNNDLRHTSYTFNDLKMDSRTPRDVINAYQLLLTASRDEVILNDSDFFLRFKEMDEQIKAYASAFAYANALEDERTSLYLTVSERNNQITSLNQAVADQEAQNASLNTTVAERDAQITGLSQTVANQEAQYANLNQAIVEQEEQINCLNQTINECNEEIVSLNQTVIKERRELAEILASKSWKITKPLRFVGRVFISYHSYVVRRVFSGTVYGLWRALPISTKSKQKIKCKLFKTLPWAFYRTNAYQVWNAYSQSINCSSGINLQKEQPEVAECEYVPLLDAAPLKQKPAKLICYYLPQFHAIPENNEWWGEGFTEWTNVKPAQPQFKDHYQPHVPGELGYYDLLDPEVQRRQVELAKLYGIGGFCFYFYWFGGKRLLEKPIENYLNNDALDLPFCLCWANENWSRRWDGLDNDILISQHHSKEDDLAFIKHISKYLENSRYIRIDGKPLLLVYRPSLLPSAKETVKRWRKWCRENGVGEIYLTCTQSFDKTDPIEFGFDAAVEFPPNNTAPPSITENIPGRSPIFAGHIYDWSVYPERSKNYQEPAYTLFRGVAPSWDNTARKKEKGTILYGSSPLGYQQWLSNAIQDTVNRFPNDDQRLVFVNAWNEWAEGTHLEPDEKYGYAYLQASRNALEHVTEKEEKRRIVLVAHDAHPHGAQYLILNMAKVLQESFGFIVDMIVLGEGPLIEEYAKYANVHELAGCDVLGKETIEIVKKLHKQGASSAITNTTVTGLIVPVLKQYGFTVVSLIHELPQLIKDYQLQEHVNAIATEADKVVFAATAVREGFESFVKLDKEKAVIRPQGIYKKNSLQTAEQIESAHSALRKRFSLPDDAVIVLGVGFADYRKGIDIFVGSGIEVSKINNNIYFLWLGSFEPKMDREVKQMIKDSGSEKRFIFPGLDYDSDIYYAGSDIYALTSREDPFPSVLMEALDVQIPVVAFKDSGGAVELLSRGGGVLVDEMSERAFSSTLNKLIASPDEMRRLGREGKQIVEQEFSFRKYLFDLAGFAETGLQRVSVVIPNYNYEQYIKDRLQSVFDQSYPIYEIIVLDDASTDESVSAIEEVLKDRSVDCKLIVNANNSGNVFKQWAKGVKLAAGDCVWIAEADDLSDNYFLEEVVTPFNNEDIVMSYCQSQQMAENGGVLCPNYHDYLMDVSQDKWLRYYVNDGHSEICEAMSIKNTIPNVSSVVFKRSVIKSVLNTYLSEIESYKVAGDWVAYVRVLNHGDIAYSPRELNMHRRHQSGVTLSTFGLLQLEEIMSVQKFVREKFNLDVDVAMKAKCYADSLYKQFGLNTGDAPTVEYNDQLSAYIDY